jgi:hypothetical protein
MKSFNFFKKVLNKVRGKAASKPPLVFLNDSNKKQPIVVHLGNVGLRYPGEVPASRTRKFASRFKDFKFVGIDLRPHGPETKNWTQLQTHMLNGLKKLENNSVSLISSEMTLGYYGQRAIFSSLVSGESVSMNYAQKVMKEALKKLKPRGKLIVVIDSKRAKLLILEGINAGFSADCIHENKLKINPAQNSYWTFNFPIDYYAHKKTVDPVMVRLVFEKK